MANTLPLSGVITALITPFSADGSRVDFESFENLIQKQLAAGVSGLVACGSTGEASTLTDAEYVEVVERTVRAVSGRCPVIAGISVSATQRAEELSSKAAKAGVQGILVATPPYNKPSQTGIARHIEAVRDASQLPVLAYNIPGRSGAAMSPALLGDLSRRGVICGVKESSGSVDVMADVLSQLASGTSLLSGEDSLTLAALAYGGTGVISASANALPAEFVKLVAEFAAGRVGAARSEQLAILPKIRALFIESNPVPVKTVLALQGIIAHPAVRLPLTPLEPASLERLKAIFGL